jgi:hypothetical protein
MKKLKLNLVPVIRDVRPAIEDVGKTHEKDYSYPCSTQITRIKTLQNQNFRLS